MGGDGGDGAAWEGWQEEGQRPALVLALLAIGSSGSRGGGGGGDQAGASGGGDEGGGGGGAAAAAAADDDGAGGEWRRTVGSVGSRLVQALALQPNGIADSIIASAAALTPADALGLSRSHVGGRAIKAILNAPSAPNARRGSRRL